jgi:ABC-type uncharacterized transport system involved in gliding motility auxiliary subunit
LLQATLLLDAFNKDRASLPQPTPQITPVPPPAPPDARTQEMINEKLKKAEELGMKIKLSNCFFLPSICSISFPLIILI